MIDPRKTGISSITGKMVVIRHATGTDLVRVAEYLNQFGKADDLGDAEVVVAAGPEEKAIKVWVDAGKETTVPLGSPGVSPVDGWRAAFVSLASVVLYAVLR